MFNNHVFQCYHNECMKTEACVKLNVPVFLVCVVQDTNRILNPRQLMSVYLIPDGVISSLS